MGPHRPAVGVLELSCPPAAWSRPQELTASTDLKGLSAAQPVQGHLRADSPTPRAPGEAVIDFGTADREDLRVGSIVRFVGAAADGTPRRFGAVRIVGVVASPGQFPAVGASSSFGRIYLTPAFVRSNGVRPSPDAAALLITAPSRCRGLGPRSSATCAAAGSGAPSTSPYAQQTQTAAIQRSDPGGIPGAVGSCALIALAALAILGQALARQTYLDSAELATLGGARPVPPPQAWLGVARAGVTGVATGGVVVPVAVLLSPLTPVGLARIAEPNPGFAVDAMTLILGAVSVARP